MGQVNSGIVIRKDDKVATAKAAKCGLALTVAQDWVMPWQNTLFIAPGTCVPWDLVCIGMDFLTRWDVAAPFWRAGVLAMDVGTPADRKRTQDVVRDLRIPVYSHELLFVRASEAGQAFITAWRAECDGGDERLAFLRAMYAVKPRFCVLPRLWLADIAQREKSDLIARQQRPRQGEPLITVEIAPGRFIKCHARDKEKVLEQFKGLNARRDRIAHGR